nr:hypothetical protein [uncultured bacterium]
MQVEELLAQVASVRENAHVRTVFGEPIRQGDRIVIPVARVQGGLGLGFGRGEAPAEAGRPSGGGGGGMFRARPVAIVEITPTEVRIRPIIDVTRIVLAGMLLTAWVAFWGNVTARALFRRVSGAR